MSKNSLFTCIIQPQYIVSYIKAGNYYKWYSSHHIHHIKIEISCVVVTNAIIQPRTMVVHSKDASITNWTMVSPRWFWRYTLLTYTRSFWYHCTLKQNKFVGRVTKKYWKTNKYLITNRILVIGSSVRLFLILLMCHNRY